MASRQKAYPKLPTEVRSVVNVARCLATEGGSCNQGHRSDFYKLYNTLRVLKTEVSEQMAANERSGQLSEWFRDEDVSNVIKAARSLGVIRKVTMLRHEIVSELRQSTNANKKESHRTDR